MKDPADNKTADMHGQEEAPRPRGRPPRHATAEEKRAAQAEASRAYRARKKAEREARKDPSKPLHSDVLDLGELPAWRRR